MIMLLNGLYNGEQQLVIAYTDVLSFAIETLRAKD